MTPAEEIGVTISERMLNQRTLTNLYNALSLYRREYKGKAREPHKWDEAVKRVVSLELVEELDFIHQELDRAVMEAYGWPAGLGDEEILERLLGLNLSRGAPERRIPETAPPRREVSGIQCLTNIEHLCYSSPRIN